MKYERGENVHNLFSIQEPTSGAEGNSSEEAREQNTSSQSPGRTGNQVGGDGSVRSECNLY